MGGGIDGWVLVTPAVIGFARGDERAEAAVWLAVHEGQALIVPALVLAQTLTDARVRRPRGQEAVAVLPALAELDPVDAARAYGVADTLAAADQPAELASDAQAMAVAHLVSVSADTGFPIVTDGTARIHAWTRAARSHSSGTLTRADTAVHPAVPGGVGGDPASSRQAAFRRDRAAVGRCRQIAWSNSHGVQPTRSASATSSR
ncbi:hypothetical protein LV78_007919 [Actinosynnema pretiosum]|nr:hypothetical protein [Actinosynnema pretiosum]